MISCKNEIIGRFYDNLPKRPYCCDNFKHGPNIRSKDQAVAKAHVELAQHRRAYLAFDVDREGAAYSWEEANLPAPTIVCVNPKNAHAHLLYELRIPVLFPLRNGEMGRASRRGMRFYKAVRRAYVSEMGSDPAYNGLLCKNPLHKAWRVATYNALYDLGELADYVDISKTSRNIATRTIDISGRNVTLFDRARFFAYRVVKRFNGQEALHCRVRRFCELDNKFFNPPLPMAEVRSVARSVASWTWRHRDRIIHKRDIGVMGLERLPAVMEATQRIKEVKERQRAGAQYVAQQKSEQAEAKIRAAIQELKTAGKMPTKSGVARLVRLSREQVSRRYSHLFGSDEGVMLGTYQNLAA